MGSSKRGANGVHRPMVLHGWGTRRASWWASGSRLLHMPFLFLNLSAHVYELLWVLIFVVSISLTLFLAAVTSIYFYVARHEMSYYAGLIASDSARLKLFGSGFLLLAILHFLQVLHMCYWSVRSHELVLHSSSKVAPVSIMVRTAAQTRSAKVHPRKFLRRHSGFWHRIWHRWFGRHGFFGVESKYFEHIFIVRELLEISAQTYQAYRSSLFISKPWINHLYVVLLTLNCWSTPLVQRTLRRHPSMLRVMCIAVDAVLNICTCVVIPFLVFLPYYQQFNWSIFGFDVNKLYDDEWFVNLILENKQVFAITRIDLLSKVIPQLTLLSCVQSMKALIRKAHPVKRVPPRPQRSSPTESLQRHDAAPVPLMPLPEIDERFRSNIEEHIVSTHTTSIHTMFVLLGFIVLILHIVAIRSSVTQESPSCVVTLRPWLPRDRTYCSVFKYNCYHRGSTSPTNQDIKQLDEEALAVLIFEHCPALEVPTGIQRFYNLLGLELYNSTVVDWSLDAAISSDAHPNLAYLIMPFVNMSEIPEGILQPFPPLLTDLELIGSNLTEFPNRIASAWSGLTLLFLEYNALPEMPDIILQLHMLDTLSLTGNNLTSFPNFRDNEFNFVFLSLGHNPMVELPQETPASIRFNFLSLEGTGLVSIPGWVQNPIKTINKIYLRDTPFCVSLPTQVADASFGASDVTTCMTEDQRGSGRYPVEFMKKLRQL